MSTKRDGFTLIELLIVVVIIGILAAIAIPKFSSTRERAFVSSLKADLRNLASLQELYHNANFTYSTDQTAVDFNASEGVTVNIPEASGQGWSATAVHVGMPAVTCALYHGNAAQVAPATVESMITCDY